MDGLLSQATWVAKVINVMFGVGFQTETWEYGFEYWNSFYDGCILMYTL